MVFLLIFELINIKTIFRSILGAEGDSLLILKFGVIILLIKETGALFFYIF